MIVQDIRTTRLRVPYPDPPNFSGTPVADRDLLIVDLESSTGVTGMGYLQPLAGGLRTLETCIHEMLAPLIVGQPVQTDTGDSNVEALWERMWDATFIQGRMGITVMAAAAIDIGLWDLLGKLRGEPLYHLWGGRAEPVPIYGSGCFRGLGRNGMIDRAQRFVTDGFQAIKMQVAHIHTADEDVTNVAAMREALGEGIEIMLDVNQGWDPQTAIDTGRRLERYHPYWLEEPVRADDWAGYREVAKSISIPVVGGENHFTHHDMGPFLDEGFAPILQPDVMRCGLTGLRHLASLASAAGLRIAPHLFHELMVHVNASIPNASWLEYMGWGDDLFQEPLMPANGHVLPPNRPGHGLTFIPALLDDHRLA